MLFTCITGPDLIEHLPSQSMGIELRLDLFPKIDIGYLKHLIETWNGPILLTLRKASQGGGFIGSEGERQSLIQKLLSLVPCFFDLEYDMCPIFLHQTIQDHPHTKFILSYHNFTSIETDVESIYRYMQKYPAFTYKISVLTPSTNDALKMLLSIKKYPRASIICMGPNGSFARVLGPIMGNIVNYASIDAAEQTAPGQLPFSDYMGIYRYGSINANTAIYGLIGDPIENSRGHLYHNEAFAQRGVDALYIKMVVTEEELPEFFQLARALDIRGLSVTSPLKEKVLPFLDELDAHAEGSLAVNTIGFQKGRMIGVNTDGIGALDAIEKQMYVRGKTVVVLGAGGAARAVAFEAHTRGAYVLILNRTLAKAKKLALDIGCKAGGLDELPTSYDLLIQCSTDPMPIDPEKIQTGTWAMDLVYCPKETLFLQAACRKQCQIIYGQEMFLNQAALQTSFWMAL